LGRNDKFIDDFVAIELLVKHLGYKAGKEKQ